MLFFDKLLEITVKIIFLPFWGVLAQKRPPEPMEKYWNYCRFCVPAARHPFPLEITEIMEITEFLQNNKILQ